jgi:hypothetical protein
MSEGDLPDGTSGIFLCGRLDDPNHVESSHEFGLYAHAIWKSEGFVSEAGAADRLSDRESSRAAWIPNQEKLGD